MTTKNEDREARAYLDILNKEGAQVAVDKDVSSYKMHLPPWYDEKLFKRAQKYHFDNIFAMFAGKLAGLLAVLSIPNIINILAYTKESGTSTKAYKRYLATIFHTISWYEHELKPGSRSWKSLEAVRKGHILASKYAEKGKIGIISQRDMALTQFGFMGYIVLKPDILGVQVTMEKHEAFIHFWRVIGYMIGIEDRFNLCTDSWQTTHARLKLVLSDVFRPSLDSTPEMFKQMATALIEGLWCFNPFLAFDSFVYYTKMMSGCEGYIYFESSLKMLDEENVINDKTTLNKIESLSMYSRFILWLEITAHSYLVNFAIIRWYLNSQINMSLIIIKYLPFLAFFTLGIKNSYVRILKNDKSL